MTDLNTVIISGKTVGDVKLKKGKRGRKISTFSLAVSYNHSEETIKVMSLDSLAERITGEFIKNRSLLVEGHLTRGRWNGTTLVADRIVPR